MCFGLTLVGVENSRIQPVDGVSFIAILQHSSLQPKSETLGFYLYFPLWCTLAKIFDSKNLCTWLGDSMEIYGVFEPLTPAKPVPARSGHNTQVASTSGRGTEKENINDEFLCTSSLGTTEYLEDNGNKGSSVLGVAGKDPKSTTTDQNNTSCIQEETKCNDNKAHDVHESQYGINNSIPSIPSPSETKDSRKRRNNGIDLNKKPSQRTRMKKHRPKVYDDSKPKKVQKPKTPKPKTPKPVTPNRVHERSVRSRKEKFKEPTSCMQKSTSYVDQRDSHHVSKLHEEAICVQNSMSYNIEDVEQASRVSRNALIPMIPCKRRLDLNYPIEGESKSHDEHLSFNFDNGDYDFFDRIVTSKRNTKRRSRFQNKSVEIEASEDLLDDNNNKQQCGLDFSVIENLKQTKKHVRRFVYVYKCQKKRNSKTSTLQVYQKKCRLDQCLQISRKSGPNFPKLFKKQRKMRKKVTINPNWLLKFLENSKKKKEPHKKLKKKVAKNNLLLLPIFSPMKKKRSILQTRRRENLVDFPISKEISLYDERFLLCQEENFLQMTECLPLQEVPIHEIDSFTSLPLHCQGVENTVAALDWLQLQEVPLLESQSWKKDRKRKSQSRKRDQSRKSQSLIPKQKDSKLYIREMTKYITKKLAKLDINAECTAIVVRNNDNRALVKTKPKKEKEKEKEKEKKILAKVDLDEESERVWKIVMENDGSQPFEEMDNDKKEWWERQRNIFRGRVDSFIAKMHLIQGNRRFSPWKGSVVDSVVGVYLTQNVSDHLSSSAFMCLAARFPVKSKNKEVVDHFEVNTSQESVKSNTEIYEGFFNNNKIDQNSITSYDDEINLSQNTQLSQTEASNLEDKPCLDENPKSFRKVLDLNEVDCLRNFYNIDESALDESKVVEESNLGEEKSKSKESEASNLEDKTFVDENLNTFRKVLETEEADYLKNFCSINVDDSALNESHVQEKSTFGQEKSTLEQEKPTFEQEKSTLEEEKSTLEEEMPTFEQEKSTIVEEKSTFEEEPRIVAPISSLQSEITMEQGVNVVNSHESNKKGKSTIEQEKSTIEEEKSTIVEEKSTLEEETRIVAAISSLQSEITMEQGVKVVNNQEINKKGKSTFEEEKSTHEEEPRIIAPISSLQSEITMEQGVKVVNKKKGKKKSKKEQKEEVKIDWEKLREIYSQNGKKEINEDFMDAVDWEAVYNTPVQEIANLIVERGMNNVLAIRIKDFLNRMVKDHGSIDLEWLRDIPPDKAKEFLLSIPGIGLKSVECVRLLTLHHNAFPVDTNVGRVATRLGWVPLQPLPEQVQIHLLNSYPMVDTIQKYLYPRLCTLDQKTLYELHYQLITFGKVFCTKLNPNCNACPMRAECRHYASAFASARLALPGPKGSSSVTTTIIPAPPASPPPLPPVQPPPPLVVADVDPNDCDSNSYVENCEPIIEIPPSPEPYVEVKLPDIEDYFCESEDEIPTIRLNTQEFEETLKETINKKNNLSFSETDDVSNAIVALSREAASFRVRVRPIKHTGKLRTIHIVYELPDFHPILAGFDEREQEDPSRYLLAIWPEISSSKNIEEETVKGTILIPCRTANRGKFPLNGTYFQVNEVFADDETSDVPMDVPRHFLWNLSRRDLACGTSATSIFKALSTGDIQHIFWRGSICVRGFNRKTRQPRPLHRRFHVSTTVNSTGNKKTPKK
ncbi:unnamed protein product [Lactuca virosa]|uniref:HhH-GPD domain-containing protein n=1 Tax=Lactuca virosa TaxID=75947 RepID=A0AAU9LC61_9ASTR|nr:unnamed protein product [Lactuca virosa]